MPFPCILRGVFSAQGEDFPQKVAIEKAVIMQGAEIPCQGESVQALNQSTLRKGTFHAEMHANIGKFGKVAFALF